MFELYIFVTLVVIIIIEAVWIKMRSQKEFTPGHYGVAHHRRVFGVCKKKGKYAYLIICKMLLFKSMMNSGMNLEEVIIAHMASLN